MTKQMLCPNCQKAIDFEASNCPHCGIAITDETRKTAKKQVLQGTVIIFSILAAIIFGLYSFFSDDKKEITFPGTPISYQIADTKLIERAATGRHRLEITIVADSSQEKAKQADLISTAMQAGISAFEQSSAPIIIVNMLAQNTGNSYADKQLAFVTYIPDQKGYDGQQKTEIWDNPMACERGFTADELTYLQLWGQLRSKYIDQATGSVPPQNEEQLITEIEQTMGKKLNSDPMLNIMRQVEIGE